MVASPGRRVRLEGRPGSELCLPCPRITKSGQLLVEGDRLAQQRQQYPGQQFSCLFLPGALTCAHGLCQVPAMHNLPLSPSSPAGTYTRLSTEEISAWDTQGPPTPLLGKCV